MDNMCADKKISNLFNLLNEAGEKFLQKRKYFEDIVIKIKFIPTNVRRLLRKKSKLSKCYLQSDNCFNLNSVLHVPNKLIKSLTCLISTPSFGNAC